MRHVEFTPPTDPRDPRFEFWSKYCGDAEKARMELFDVHASGVAPDPRKSALWGRLKKWMLENVFAKRCAYCEGDLSGHAPMHAEHWRPKAAVTDLSSADADEVPVEENGVPHPGYWWLAYDWRNLLPACDYCNTAGAKGTKFPITGERVFKPEQAADPVELDRIEAPRLLHPLYLGDPADPDARKEYQDPADHIDFYHDGTAFAKGGSPLGEMTIKVMGLNRDDLVGRRETRQIEAYDAFRNALGESRLLNQTIDDRMVSYDGPGAVYRSAVRARLLPLEQELAAELLRRAHP